MSTSGNGLLSDAQDLSATAFRGWSRFWFHPTDPTTLCFMRFCAGLVLLYVYAGYTVDLMSYVHPTRGWFDEKAYSYIRTKSALFPPPGKWTEDPEEMQRRAAYMQAIETGDAAAEQRLYDQLQIKPFDRGQYNWSIFFHLHDERWIWVAHITMLVCLLLFTLGLWTRIMTVLVWIGALSYIERTSNMVFGMDTMIVIALMYLMIGPAGATLSLDRWIKVWRARRTNPGAVVPLEPSIGANLAIRLFQVHFCFIYAFSGLSKLQGGAWWNGTALWYCMANYSFAPMTVAPYNWFLHLLCDSRLMWELFMSGSAVFTLVLEIGFPFLVWIRRLRWLMVCGAVMLHFGIGLIMGLVGFSMMMMVLVASFVPPELVRMQVDRLLSIRFFRGRPTAAVSPLPVGARSDGLAVAGTPAG